jgi:peroxiredoxin
MALTLSKMAPLGSLAPPFELPDTEGKRVSLSDFNASPALLVMFICNHCPYVKAIRRSLSEVTKDFLKRGVAVVGINSNDADEYPEDSPEKMKTEKKAADYAFSYLFDETQEIAAAYGATCTPDFFLFDKERKLVYRGQWDSSRPGKSEPTTGADVVAAVDALMLGKAVSLKQVPSIGCNIKWKSA